MSLVTLFFTDGSTSSFSVMTSNAVNDERTRLVIQTCATIDALANASPRNPKVRILFKSSTCTSFEVAKRVHANGKSNGEIPMPSSETIIESNPPCDICISICDASASKLFSISSLTTLIGRWTTSPAAIRSTTSFGSGLIFRGGRL